MTYRKTMVAQSWPQRIKSIRATLKLSQTGFASLIGFTPAAVNRWETGAAVPTGLAVVLLELLSSALLLHPRTVLLRVLRIVGPDPLSLVRSLVWLEWHPTQFPALAGAPAAPPHPMPFSPTLMLLDLVDAFETEHRKNRPASPASAAPEADHGATRSTQEEYSQSIIVRTQKV